VNSINDLRAFFIDRDLSSYDRDNFDRFLKAIRFSFTIPAIHVTGTNGKGSTVNYLRGIYMHAGYKVGTFISPYFTSMNEMIAVNDVHISDEDVLRLFNDQEANFNKFQLTSFEIQTYLAFAYLKEQKPDLAIIEVGMGGYLDATNIFNNILAIITSVSLEHTNYLGKSISEIAKSKSGIIKDRAPVLVGELDESAMYAIRETAKECRSPLFVVDDYHNDKVEEVITFDYRPYHDLKLNTKAKYQLKNASLAIEATKILVEAFPVVEDNIRQGLLISSLEARYERINDNIIVDGAHNPEAIENLMMTVMETEAKPIHVLFAAFRDKNHSAMLTTLSKDAASITLTTFPHKRARTKDEYFFYLDEYPFYDDYHLAMQDLRAKYPEDIILITGSLAFAAMASKYLRG
jgi:dihydrofolate synthase/folylpolyglutamate synthase